MYYVSHEILSETTESVQEFMKGQVPEGTSEEEVVKALTDVGFTDKMRAGEVPASLH